jgi:hypothetical protein
MEIFLTVDLVAFLVADGAADLQRRYRTEDLCPTCRF